MRKFFLLIVVLVFSSTIVLAQKNGKTRFSVGAELGLTTGTSALTNSLGIGASVQAEHFFQEDLSGTVLFGVVSYIGRSASSTQNYKAYSVTPLRAGVRYYIGDGFHIGAQIGVGFATGGTAFAYSPQIGYNFKTSKGKSIDTDFKYDGYSNSGTFSALGIRVGYIF